MQSQNDLTDWRALAARLQKKKHESLRQCAARGETGQREKLAHAGLILKFLVHLGLERAHLRRGRSFLRDENATNETAVARRYQRERQIREEKPESKDASGQNRHGEPCAIEKPVERSAVSSDYPLNEIAGVALHPCRFMASFALPEDPRAHQRRERQRYKPRSENGNDDRDGEFTKNAAEQSRNKNERNENRGQRESHRQNRERNFAGAIESRFEDRLTVLGPAHDVFQKYDRVINKETDGQRQRHQREIIDREVQHVHHRDGEQQRHRQGDRRNQRVCGAAEEDINHNHDKHERDHQRPFHLVSRIDNRLRPVEHR